MERKVLTLLSVFLFSLFCLNATAQVEFVFSDIVTEPDTLIEAYDAWFSSKDSKQGQTTTLLENFVNGDSNSTHTTILDFPDYASLETSENLLPDSIDFAKLQRRTSGIATGVWEGLSLRLVDNGKSWKAGDYVWGIGIQVAAGESKTYAAAFKEYINSKTGKKAPGLLRLLASRAGSTENHVVLVSAPTFVELNKFMDSSGESEDFANFRSKVKAIAIGNSSPSISRVVKIWK